MKEKSQGKWEATKVPFETGKKPFSAKMPMGKG